MSFVYFGYFAIYIFMNFPSENDMTLNLNKFEFKNALCRVWLSVPGKKILDFSRIGFLFVVNESSLFRYYQPLETGLVLHLNKLEFLSPRMS